MTKLNAGLYHDCRITDAYIRTQWVTWLGLDDIDFPMITLDVVTDARDFYNKNPDAYTTFSITLRPFDINKSDFVKMC